MESGIATESSRQELLRALKEKSLKVVALTGAWGTGKTFLWRECSKEIADQQPIEVSAFGITSILELKKRLLHALFPTDNNTAIDSIDAVTRGLKDIIKKFSGITLDDVALLTLPSKLSGRIIAIDDIERKHKNLDIEELLGFINEYSEKHDTRFVLLLNTDELEDNKTWQTLHEKVIDTEIVLSPLPEDSFKIAAHGESAEYLEKVKNAITLLKITNIRVIKRVLRATSLILEKQADLNTRVYESIIPQIVLLSSAHYRGIRNEITLDYILNFSYAQSGETITPLEIKWKNTVNDVKYIRDTFSSLVAQYLKTGVVNHQEITKYLAPRNKNLKKTQLSQNVSTFLTNYSWDPLFNTQTAMEFYNYVTPLAYEVEAREITDLCHCLQEFQLEEQAQSLVDLWIRALQHDPNGANRVSHTNPNYLHPQIVKAKEFLKEPPREAPTLEQAIKNLRLSGIKDPEEYTFKNSTRQQYIEILERLRGEDLKVFAEFHLYRETNERRALYIARANFKAACREIFEKDQNSRLSKILERAFRSVNLDITKEPAELEK